MRLRRPAVVVFAVGNRSRGDDALGPLLLERLAAALAADAVAAEFELVEDYQLQIEHALELEGRDLALFIDAGMGTRAPFAFRGVAPGATARDTHALTPAAVLDVYRRVAHAAPPPAFVLCVRGESFELGAGPSPRAQAHLQQAWEQLARLCARPQLAYWSAMAQGDSGAQGEIGPGAA